MYGSVWDCQLGLTFGREAGILSSSDLERFKSPPNLITNYGRQLCFEIHQSVNMTNEFHPASTLNPRPLHASTTWCFGTRSVPSTASKSRGKSTIFIPCASVQKTLIIDINAAENLNNGSVILTDYTAQGFAEIVDQLLSYEPEVYRCVNISRHSNLSSYKFMQYKPPCPTSKNSL
jgi:hypothetical protein